MPTGKQYFFFSQMRTYSKFLLTDIGAKKTFRAVFDFKKLKMIYCCDVYYFLFRIQASGSLK